MEDRAAVRRIFLTGTAAGELSLYRQYECSSSVSPIHGNLPSHSRTHRYIIDSHRPYSLENVTEDDDKVRLEQRVVIIMSAVMLSSLRFHVLHVLKHLSLSQIFVIHDGEENRDMEELVAQVGHSNRNL